MYHIYVCGVCVYVCIVNDEAMCVCFETDFLLLYFPWHFHYNVCDTHNCADVLTARRDRRRRRRRVFHIIFSVYLSLCMHIAKARRIITHINKIACASYFFFLSTKLFFSSHLVCLSLCIYTTMMRVVCVRVFAARGLPPCVQSSNILTPSPSIMF